MFKYAVDTLPLEFTGLNFRDSDGYNIAPETLVSEIMEPVCRDGNPFLPDYGIRGFFHNRGIAGESIFQIDPRGLYLLYVTGKPHIEDYPEDDRFKFHDSDSLWSHYWEDNKVGYLIQIILIENKKINFINEN